MKPRRLVATTVIVSLVAFAVLTSISAQAANTAPFLARYTTNANGAIVTIGNNLLSCTASVSPCTQARAGSSYDNNYFWMSHYDNDSVTSTFNSSMSRLDLPEGSTVLWAGLYWGARLQAGTGGQAGTGTRTQMQLRTPGAAGYQTITSQQEFGPNTSSYNAYQEFADVTALVRAAGNGEYWGANVVAATGADRYAGWSLTVAYSAPGMPLRNLTVFDGFNVVGSGSPQTITVSGFQAPRAGTVDAQLGMVAYEGDLSQTGDYTRLNNTQLATAISPGSNFFDSTNDLNGTSVTTRSPADRNMLGFDIKNLGASGVIPNGATSATFTFSSSGDVYYPGVLTTAINLYAPDFTASSKSVVNTNGNSPARPGDVLQYTLNYANTGQDPAVNVVSTDPLPPGTTYVPGSLALLNPVLGTTTPLTDGADADAGQYDPVLRTVQVRLGTMACSGTGCPPPANPYDDPSRASYTFQVRLDPTSGGTTVTNLAHLDYNPQTTPEIDATYTTSPAVVTVVRQADVSITKDLSPDPAAVGSTVSATLTVRNAGPNTATGVTVTDPVPAGWNGVSASLPPGAPGSCAVTAGTVTCSLGDLADGATVPITLTGTTAPDSTATALTNVASVSTSSYDPQPTDNVSGDTIVLNRQADLSITKSTSATPVPGNSVSFTLTVTNDGPSDAQDVLISDTVADPSQVRLTDAVGSAGVTCGPPQGASVVCGITTLASGGSATVTVTGTLATDLAQGTTVADTATVVSATADPDGTDNQATAQVTVGAPYANVQLTKTGPASVVAGTSISYQIVATNYGPSDATGVNVTDQAPAGVTFTQASTSRGSCTVTATALTCPVGTLPAGPVPGQAGASATIVVYGTVDPATSPGTVLDGLRNTAVATAMGATTRATAYTDTVRSFDLAVSKQADRTFLPTGAEREVTYTITVGNNGPSVATGVTVRDLVPLDLDLVSAQPTSGTCDTDQADVPQPDGVHGLVTCALADPVPVGGTQTVTVVMVAPDDFVGGPDLTETVTVTAPGDDPSLLANNSATWTLSGEEQIDLGLTKTAPTPVTAGDTVTYSLDITNHSTLPALAPTLVDTLPAGVSLVPAGADSDTPSWCSASGQNVTCALPAGIAPGATTTVELSVKIDPALDSGTALVNTATVTNHPDETDPSLANNTATATSTVETDADVGVALAVGYVDPSATGPGTQRTISITITNDGPSVARNVSFRLGRTVDAFVVDAGNQPANCANTAREVVCTLDEVDLDPGQSVTIEYVIAVAGYATPGSYPDTIQVSSLTPDSDLDNNTDEDPIVVGDALTDLVVTKTPVGTVANPDEPTHQAFVAGGAFSYQLTVTVPQATTPPGAGYSDAQGVVLSDRLPLGFVPTSATSTAGSCTVEPPDAEGRHGVSCPLGTVPGWTGSTAPPAVVVTVHGTLDPDANDLNGGDEYAEQVENTATVTTTTPLVDDGDDTIPADTRTAVAPVDIVEMSDLRLTKTPDQDTVVAGGSVGFTLTVTNAGPSSVEHAVLFDSLPVGFTLDATASGCEPPRTSPEDETQAQPQVPDGPGDEIACRVGEVEAGRSVSIRIVATTDPYMAPGTVTNTATVGSLAHDDDPSNNTATTEEIVVQRLTNLAISAGASTTTPAAGQTITLTGFAVNNGPSSADGTNGDTTFPAGFVPVSWDVPFNDCTWRRSTDPGTVVPQPADPTTVPYDGSFSWVLHCEPMTPGAKWEPGGAATNVVVMHIPDDMPVGTFDGRSVIRSDTPETTLDDNTTTLTFTVNHVADTSITKTLVDPDPMLAGRPATWRLTVANAGPSVADNVMVSDTVPDGMTFVSAATEDGTACPAPEVRDTETVVRCPMGSLEPGQSASALVTFGVGPDAEGDQLCNAALVGSGGLDPNATDNQARTCGQVVAPPATDVALTVTSDTPHSRVGDPAQFTAVVRNNGPELATSVVMTFDVPDELVDVTGVLLTSSDGATPEATCTGRLVCTVGSLEPGQSVTYRIVGVVAALPDGPLVLTGVVTHGEADTDPSNDIASDFLVVEADVLPGGTDDGPDGLAVTGATLATLLALAVLALAGGLWWLVTARRGRHAR